MIFLIWSDGIDIRRELWQKTLKQANDYATWYNRENPTHNMVVKVR